MESTISDLTRSLEYTEAEVGELKGELKELSKSDLEKQKTINELMASVRELEERTNHQEDYSRRNNLCISGMGESPSGETWEITTKMVQTLFEDKLQLPPMKLERAHRTGQFGQLKLPTVVARFEKFGDREAVLRNARKLNGTGIFINEDLCQASREKLNSQLPLLKHARSEGKIAFFKYINQGLNKSTPRCYM